jgi:hypothetical protein
VEKVVNKVLLFVSFLLVVTVVAIASYWYGNSGELPAIKLRSPILIDSEEVGESPVATASPSTSDAVAPAATVEPNAGQTTKPMEPGWKKYEDGQGGYSFEYPSDLELDHHDNGGVSIFKWGPTQRAETEFYDGVSILFLVENMNGKSLEQIAKERVGGAIDMDGNPVAINPVVIAGLNGIKYVISELGTATFYFLPLDGGRYLRISSGTSDPTNQGYFDIVDKILSSIKVG